MRRQDGRHPLRARSQAEGLRIGCIRRMPRQRANVSRSRACRHGELRRLSTMSCCVLARKQIEVYMDAYGECRDSERKAQRFSAVRSRACRHGELRRFCAFYLLHARSQTEGLRIGRIRRMPRQLNILFYAAMAELADAADLGSVGQPPCRFKSC